MADYIVQMIRAARGIANISTRVLSNDMGSCARAVWKIFGISLQRDPKNPLKITNSFQVDDMIIRACPDPEHEIKNTRCGLYNLAKKNIFPVIGESVFLKYKIGYNLSSPQINFLHIQHLYEFERDKEFRYAPKLSPACFEFKTNFARMDVPTAIAVFSQEVAVGLRMMVREHGYSQDYLTTALFCEYFGKWVNIITSRSSSFCLSYNDRTKYAEMMTFLTDFMLLIDSLEFPTKGRKPWQAGIICTTTTVMELSKELLDSDSYEFFLPGRLSSAACETFFSCIRSYNRAPSCLETERIIKVLSFIQMNKSTKNSCYLNDEDGPNWIATFKELKAIADAAAEKDENAVIFAEPCPNDFLTRDFSEEQVYVHVLGCVLKRTICTQSFCQLCKSILTTDTPGPEHKLIELKQWRDGVLVLPSKDAIEWFSMAEAYFQSNRDKLLTSGPRTLDELAKTTYDSLVETPIPACHLRLLVDRFYKFRMNFWSKHLHAQIVVKKMAKIKAQQHSSRSMAGHHLK